MRLPTEVLIFDAERRRMLAAAERRSRRAWFRPAARTLPVEGWFVVALVTAAWVLYALAAPARPLAPASITNVAPACSDSSRAPCRGRV